MLFPLFVRIRTLDSRVRGNDTEGHRSSSRWTRPASVHYNAFMPRHCARLAPAKAGVMWCLGVGCLALALVMLHAFVPQRARDVARAQADAPARDGLDLTSLNVRLSQRAIHPPKPLVKEVVDLPHIQAARARIAPSPKSAIWKMTTIPVSSFCRCWKMAACRPRCSPTSISRNTFLLSLLALTIEGVHTIDAQSPVGWAVWPFVFSRHSIRAASHETV